MKCNSIRSTKYTCEKRRKKKEGEISGEADKRCRRVGGLVAAAAEACDVGWRSRKMKEGKRRRREGALT